MTRCLCYGATDANTCSPAPLGGCRSAIRWKAELSVQRRQGPSSGHGNRERRPPRSNGIGVSQLSDTAQRHVYTVPQTVGHMRAGSADQEVLAASKSEARKRSHYAWPGQVSFDERRYKLATLALESVGRPGKEGSDLIDQVAASIVGGTDGSPLSRKGFCKERIFKSQ